MFDRLVPEYTGPRYPEISTLMMETMAVEIFDQGRPPAEVFAAAQEEISALD